MGGYGWLLGGIPSPLPPLAFHMFHVSEVTIIGQTLGKTTEVLSVSGCCFQFCQTQAVTSSRNTFALFETLLYSSNFARHTKSQVQVVPGNMHFAILYDANAINNTLPATHTYKFRQSARGQRSVWLQDQLTEFDVSYFYFLFFLVSSPPPSFRILENLRMWYWLWRTIETEIAQVGNQKAAELKEGMENFNKENSSEGRNFLYISSGGQREWKSVFDKIHKSSLVLYSQNFSITKS